jgi:hypothetical protein
MRDSFGFFVRIFENDPRWCRRVLAAGGCGLLIAGAVVLKEFAKLQAGEMIAVLTMLPAFFLLAGCLLATMDSVRTRIESGAQVSWPLRAFFGSLLSAWLWVAAVLIVGFPLAVFVGSLTWKR